MCGPSTLIYIQLSESQVWVQICQHGREAACFQCISTRTSSTVYTMNLLVAKIQPIKGLIRSTVMFKGLWVQPVAQNYDKSIYLYMQCICRTEKESSCCGRFIIFPSMAHTCFINRTHTVITVKAVWLWNWKSRNPPTENRLPWWYKSKTCSQQRNIYFWEVVLTSLTASIEFVVSYPQRRKASWCVRCKKMISLWAKRWMDVMLC